MLEQPALPVKTPRVALEIAIARDDPMTWHYDGDGIGAVGCTDIDGGARVIEAQRLG